MKSLFFVFLISLSIFSNAQNDSTQIFKKENLLGIDFTSAIIAVTQHDINPVNLSIKYMHIKSNNLLYQIELRINGEYKDYSFVHCDSLYKHYNHHVEHLNLNLNFSYGESNKVGKGIMYVTGDLILGYVNLSNSIYELLYNKDSTMYNSSYRELVYFRNLNDSYANYFSLGLGFSVGYKIDLSKRLSLNIEYSPQFTLNTLINVNTTSKIYEIDYKQYEANVCFNLLAINLLYRFK